MNKWIFSLLPFALLADDKPPVPPGGVLERQLEQEYDTKEVEAHKTIPLLEFDFPEKEIEIGDEKIVINSVEFFGNLSISSKKLQRTVQPFLGKEMSMKEIHEMCLAIQAKYGRRGYFLARVFVPPQEIRDHHLKIEIIEGKLGKVSVIGNKYYSEKFISRYFDKYTGEPINYDQILKALLLLDENSDLDVAAVFKKGSTFGTSDLLVKVTDKKPLHLMVDTNNFGSDHTSNQRTGARFEWGNLLVSGDMLTVIQVVGSPMKNLDFTQGIYHFPINTYGSSMDFSYLFANFKTDKVRVSKEKEEGEKSELRYKGRSVIGTVKFDQAIHRTRTLNTDFFTSFDYKKIQNFGGGTETSNDELRVLSGGMAIDYIDGLQGRNLFNGSVGWGIPSFLGGMSAVDSQSSRFDGGGGRFVKINGSWKRLQRIPYNCFLLLNVVMQYSFNKLPLPEQIYIGGMDTVRGYPLAAGLGDTGFYGTLELRVPPPVLRAHKVPWSKKTWGEFLQFVGFVDHGHTFDVRQNVLREMGLKFGKKKKEHVAYDNTILTSAGVGARLYGPWKLEWSLDIGYPLTEKHRSSNTIVYFRVTWNIL